MSIESIITSYAKSKNICMLIIVKRTTKNMSKTTTERNKDSLGWLKKKRKTIWENKNLIKNENHKIMSKKWKKIVVKH